LASSYDPGPTFLFAVSGLILTHRETFVPRHQAGRRELTPTGVLLAGKSLITRNHRAHVSDVLTVRRPRRTLNLDQGQAPHHLTSSRVVVIKDRVITGCGEAG